MRTGGMGIPARRDLPVGCSLLIDTGKGTCPCHPDYLANRELGGPFPL